MSNRLLQRKQFVIDVLHGGRPNVPKAELKQKLMTMYKVNDGNCIFLYGFETKFGGGRSTGFGLIYDNVKAAQQIEPKFRLVRQGLVTSTPNPRKLRKERKNRAKKVRGAKKAKAAASGGKKKE